LPALQLSLFGKQRLLLLLVSLTLPVLPQFVLPLLFLLLLLVPPLQRLARRLLFLWQHLLLRLVPLRRLLLPPLQRCELRLELAACQPPGAARASTGAPPLPEGLGATPAGAWPRAPGGCCVRAGAGAGCGCGCGSGAVCCWNGSTDHCEGSGPSA
jgi:hypothetical protein